MTVRIVETDEVLNLRIISEKIATNILERGFIYGKHNRVD